MAVNAFNTLAQAFLEKGIKLSSVKEFKDGGSFILDVQAKPGAKRTSIEVTSEGGLKVTLRERPVEGAANKGVRELLAESFGLSQSQISLISGEKSKLKRFELFFLFTTHKGSEYYKEKLQKLLG